MIDRNILTPHERHLLDTRGEVYLSWYLATIDGAEDRHRRIQDLIDWQLENDDTRRDYAAGNTGGPI